MSLCNNNDCKIPNVRQSVPACHMGFKNHYVNSSRCHRLYYISYTIDSYFLDWYCATFLIRSSACWSSVWTLYCELAACSKHAVAGHHRIYSGEFRSYCISGRFRVGPTNGHARNGQRAPPDDTVTSGVGCHLDPSNVGTVTWPIVCRKRYGHDIAWANFTFIHGAITLTNFIWYIKKCIKKSYKY